MHLHSWLWMCLLLFSAPSVFPFLFWDFVICRLYSQDPHGFILYLYLSTYTFIMQCTYLSLVFLFVPKSHSIDSNLTILTCFLFNVSMAYMFPSFYFQSNNGFILKVSCVRFFVCLFVLILFGFVFVDSILWILFIHSIGP